MAVVNCVKAILFDLDGTLLDTRALILNGMRHTTLTVLGRTFSDAELMDKVGMPLREMMMYFDADKADQMVEVYREHYPKVEDRLIADFAGTSQALEDLLEQGIRLAVVTSKRNDQALYGLNRYGLTDYFEFIIGQDDTSKHKPNPDPLLLGAERLGVLAEQCIYLGDSPYDMQAAIGANQIAVAALWGMFSKQRLLDAGAQYQLASISELPEFVKKYNNNQKIIREA